MSLLGDEVRLSTAQGSLRSCVRGQALIVSVLPKLADKQLRDAAAKASGQFAAADAKAWAAAVRGPSAPGVLSAGRLVCSNLGRLRQCTSSTWCFTVACAIGRPRFADTVSK